MLHYCVSYLLEHGVCPKGPYEVYHLISTKVKLQCGDVARLPAAADVSQLQLEVVPPTICHLYLIQTQAHWSS